MAERLQLVDEKSWACLETARPLWHFLKLNWDELNWDEA
jgi:hypothetical protein